MKTTTSPAAQLIANANRFSKAMAYLTAWPALEEGRLEAKLADLYARAQAEQMATSDAELAAAIRADFVRKARGLVQSSEMRDVFFSLAMSSLGMYSSMGGEHLLAIAEDNIEQLKK